MAPGGHFFCFPQPGRLAQCLPGAQATWGSLLVCLPDQRGPHPQALSWTNGDPLAGSFGGDGALAPARAAAPASVRSGDAGTLRQARSAALAGRAGGAGVLALGARWGACHSADPALGPGRLWQNHAAFRLGAPTPSAGRLALAGGARHESDPLLGRADRGPATLWRVCAELWANRGGAARVAPAAAAFHHPHSVAPGTGRALRPSRP